MLTLSEISNDHALCYMLNHGNTLYIVACVAISAGQPGQASSMTFERP
jgi:hypothetical protein